MKIRKFEGFDRDQLDILSKNRIARLARLSDLNAPLVVLVGAARLVQEVLVEMAYREGLEEIEDET